MSELSESAQYKLGRHHALIKSAPRSANKSYMEGYNSVPVYVAPPFKPKPIEPDKDGEYPGLFSHWLED